MGFYLCTRSLHPGVHSSAGSEHLPYKQGVTGSNPVEPTTFRWPQFLQNVEVFFLPSTF